MSRCTVLSAEQGRHCHDADMPRPIPNEAVSNVVFGGDDFVSTLARKVLPDFRPFELDVERPNETSKVVFNSRGSVHSWGGSETSGTLAKTEARNGSLSGETWAPRPSDNLA
jgi:hypothetical protein